MDEKRMRRGQEGGCEPATCAQTGHYPAALHTHHTPGVVAHENSNWRGRACLQRSYHLPVMRSAAQARNERHRGARVGTRACVSSRRTHWPPPCRLAFRFCSGIEERMRTGRRQPKALRAR